MSLIGCPTCTCGTILVLLDDIYSESIASANSGVPFPFCEIARPIVNKFNVAISKLFRTRTAANKNDTMSQIKVGDQSYRLLLAS